MFTTLETAIATSLGTQRIVATMTTIFAGIALALSAVGLYSVLAYAVAQRVPEIGIRMALGAHRGQVIGMIMRSGARLVGLGMAIGVAGAVAVARVIQAQLFNVAPLDPLVYAAVVILFGAVAALACLLPSLRASRIVRRWRCSSNAPVGCRRWTFGNMRHRRCSARARRTRD